MFSFSSNCVSVSFPFLFLFFVHFVINRIKFNDKNVLSVLSCQNHFFLIFWYLISFVTTSTCNSIRFIQATYKSDVIECPMIYEYKHIRDFIYINLYSLISPKNKLMETSKYVLIYKTISLT